MGAKPGQKKSTDGDAIDRWLVRTGITMATCSIAFAGFMIAFRDRPRVFGMEHLAIFAQPNRSTRIVRNHLQNPDNRVGLPEAVDTTPTGSIPSKDVPIAADGYEVIGASSSRAWLKSGDTILTVSIGQRLSGIGLVKSIVKRDGAWRLLDDNGNELRSKVDAGPTTPSHPAGKNLIFEEK